MSHSLDRLIDLAQKTGDRLIVHDPIGGRDVVIMDVSVYERLVLPPDADFGDMEDWDSDMEDIPFSEEDPWHSTGSVIEDKHRELFPEGIPFGPDDSAWNEEPDVQPVPVAEDSKTEIPQAGKEEPLSPDEPIFYEEPV